MDDPFVEVDHGHPIDGDAVDLELRALRADVAERAADATFFYQRVLGGKWTAAHRGVIADGIAGYCRAGACRAWCTTFQFPKQLACYYNRYGRESCEMLTKEFCLRGDHFFGIWLAESGGEDGFLYTDAQLASYVEDLPWTSPHHIP